MEGWRTVLMEGYTTTKDKADVQIQKLKIRLGNVLPKKRCVQCGATCMLGDLLELRSADDSCNHPHCFDCLQEQYERQRGYNEQWLSTEVSEFGLLNNVILCTKCLMPSVVVQLSSVATGFSQTKSGTACVQFKMVPELTEKVRETANCQVVDHYENQRRGLFGRFKHGKLLPIMDSRGQKSNQHGQSVDIDKLEKLDSGWVWLNKWCRDSDVGDPSGWQYAFNWPKTGCLAKNATWENAPSNTTFVRHRRMLRSKIRLIPELKDYCRRKKRSQTTLHDDMSPEQQLADAAILASFTKKPKETTVGFSKSRQGSVMFAGAGTDPDGSPTLDQPLMSNDERSEATMDYDDGGAVGVKTNGE